MHGCIFSKLLASVPTLPDSFGIQTVYIRIYRLFRTGDQISHIYEGVNAYKIIFQHIVGRFLTFLGNNVWMFDIFVVELAVLHLKKKKNFRAKKGYLPDFDFFRLASLPVNFVTRCVKAPASSPYYLYISKATFQSTLLIIV